MSLIFFRNKGNTSNVQAGHQDPLPVAVIQQSGEPDIVTTSRVYLTPSVTIPGIGTAAAYAAGDAFGTKFSFNVPVEGTISNVVFIDYDDEGIRKDLVLFGADFTATADNSAFNVSDADLKQALPVITIDLFYNFGANQLGQATPALSFRAPSRRLYCQLITQGADNIAAGSIPELYLVIV